MELFVQLDSQSGDSLYRQLSQSLKEAIADGRLSPGSMMPSVRSLGTSLSLSRSTILKAYEELQLQGYLEVRTGLGTFVTQAPPGTEHQSPHETPPPSRSSASLSAYGERLARSYGVNSEKDLPDIFNRNVKQDHAPLPMSFWRRRVAKYYDERRPKTLAQDGFGYRRLREAAATFLARSRAVRCDASRLSVMTDQESCFDLICRLLIDQGDCVALENPGYHGVRQTLEAHGARTIAVPVDSEGICVEYLYSLKVRVKFVYTTPAVHEPSGTQMSAQRRRQLLEWASSTGAFIVEDDYDCEFRQTSNSLPSIQGLDESDSVIYLRSFHKVMAPMVRVGFMVVPKCLRALVSLAKQKCDNIVPLSEQQALSDFIDAGLLERQIRDCRDLYSKRSCSVIFALTHYIGRKISVSKVNGGTFVRVCFHSTILADRQILHCARQAGVPMANTEVCYLQDSVPGEFVVSFSGWQESSINNVIMHFAYLLDCMEASEQAALLDFSSPVAAAASTNQEAFPVAPHLPIFT